MHTERIIIAARFRGPPRAGNGGYVSGRIAKHLRGTIATRLMVPAPLGKELHLESSEDQARLFDGATLLGEARLAEFELTPPAPPSYEQAVEASASYIGFKKPYFMGCFVCGPDRQPPDGLRILPGAVDGTTILAAPWTPHPALADESGNVNSEFLWSALDCTGGIAVFPAVEDLVVVLGDFRVSISDVLKAGERCVVMGWRIGKERRKHFAGSAVYATDGRLVALARAVWIEVPRSNWG